MVVRKISSTTDLTKTMSLQKSRFTEMLIEKNALDQNGFESWIFCQGMLFNSPDKWWGDHGRRDFPHEGIDLCLYRDRSRRIGRIDEKTQIPLLQDGVIKAIFKDYLGHALIVEHEKSARNTARLISFYAHTEPRSSMDVGKKVKKGEIIATLAGTSNSKANILPHLHFSLGYPLQTFSYDGFVWNSIRNPDFIRLLDPLPVIDWPYQALDAGDSTCSEI